jgi:amidophosphoribosyltransferase
MARDAGATKVYMASAAPPVRYAHVYGIDMPSRNELIASNRTEEEICREIGADADLPGSGRSQGGGASDPLQSRCFETSCFDGCYVTGDVTPNTFPASRSLRCDAANKPAVEDGGGQMDLNLISRSES